MVWNITKEGVRTRMAVVNPEAYLSVSLRTRLLFTSLSLFAPTEIPTGECCTARQSGYEKQPRWLTAPSRLPIFTNHRGAVVMTQKTFRFTRSLLMMLSAALAFALVIFLEVKT